MSKIIVTEHNGWGYCLRAEDNSFLYTNQMTPCGEHCILYCYPLGFREKQDSDIFDVVHGVSEADKRLYDLALVAARNLLNHQRQFGIGGPVLHFDEIVDQTRHAEKKPGKLEVQVQTS